MVLKLKVFKYNEDYSYLTAQKALFARNHKVACNKL